MSLTSYRAAPPRVSRVTSILGGSGREGRELGMRAWRRPTLPHLEVEYHWRRGFSRPSSGWDRVFGPSPWPPGRQSCPREACPRAGGERGSLSCDGEEASSEAASEPALAGTGGLAAMRGGLGSSANRAISTGQLRGLLRFHLRPIDVVVFHGSRRDLVLRRVSRLDAFSGYPVRT